MKKDDKNITFMKLFWIFFIGCILGYIIEVSFYLIKHGVFMNKQGLLYGPFKPMYGLGAVFITVILYFFRNRKSIIIFLYGSIIGATFEYISSVVLEYLFGTCMWNYSKMPYNINGRIFIPYIPIWGIIALIWLKFLYPKFNTLYNKIPKKIMYVLTVFLVIFMTYDIFISSVATSRMTKRAHNIEPTTKVEKYIDKKYTDEYILKRIPYLRVVD